MPWRRIFPQNHTNIIDEYPTTVFISPVISPLVAYFSNSPLVAPKSFTAFIIEAIAP